LGGSEVTGVRCARHTLQILTSNGLCTSMTQSASRRWTCLCTPKWQRSWLWLHGWYRWPASHRPALSVSPLRAYPMIRSADLSNASAMPVKFYSQWNSICSSTLVLCLDLQLMEIANRIRTLLQDSTLEVRPQSKHWQRRSSQMVHVTWPPPCGTNCAYNTTFFCP
jgi:hypothetical protein